MSSKWCGLVAAAVVFGFAGFLALAGMPPTGASVPAQALDNELPVELRYVPTDSALFVYADAAAIWDHSIVKSVRKADAKLLDHLTATGKDAFGLSPDDVKTVVVFVPKLKEPSDSERFGVVITFKKAYDKDKIQKGAEKLLHKNAKVQVAAVNDRAVLVLLNLGAEYAKPQADGKSGPLTAALKAAASGKHAAVAGITVANLPEQLRDADGPAPFRPFLPIFKATSVTATIDLGKTIDLDLRIKAGTAGHASECERALGVLLGLVQDSLNDGLKEFADAKEPGLKDLIVLMKAGITTTKAAKFETLGNEMRMTVSMATDLPFAAAYLAAKKKVEAAGAALTSSNNLKQIGFAMHSYHDTKEAFPPAAVCDKTGKPLLSWRVLILPYIEQEALFKEFKLDEAWDSEHNKKLLAKMPKVYSVPGQTKPGDTDTHYRVFVGNGAGFEWIMGGKIQAITDGTSNTLMCVTAETAVPWTKPEELEFNPEKDMTKLVGLVVNGKMQAAYFDGSVRTFAKIPAKITLHALITKSGGEVVDIDR